MLDEQNSMGMSAPRLKCRRADKLIKYDAITRAAHICHIFSYRYLLASCKAFIFPYASYNAGLITAHGSPCFSRCAYGFQ